MIAQLMPVLVLGGMILIFVGTYVWNKRTPAPEMPDGIDKAACSTCNLVTCANHGGEE